MANKIQSWDVGNPQSIKEPTPIVAILMCTYQGGRFLAEQLNSLQYQTHQNWFVIASDDGSDDQTLKILQQYMTKWPDGRLTIRSGPKKGFSQNFLSLACDPKIKADYYAFCDQDDVWFPNKLYAALKVLNLTENRGVCLYCSRTLYGNEFGEEVGESPKYVHPKTFRNALVQCVAGGNTMVFNVAAKLLLEAATPVSVPSHDWWLYQLITGNGGKVYFDQTPRLIYRQHPHSLVGENTSLVSKLDRFMMVITGQFRKMISENIHAIECNLQLLSQENLQIFLLFKKMRNRGIKDRFRLTEVCGIYRQSWRGTLSLILALVLKKI